MGQCVTVQCVGVGAHVTGKGHVRRFLCMLLLLLLPLVSCAAVQSELEDAVFIWCAEGSTHNASSSSSSTHGPPAAAGCSSGASTPQALSPRAAAATAVGTSCGGSSSAGGGPFVLDCLLPLEDTAASLAWLDTGGLPPLLAVGVASGVVEVYSRDRR